MYLFRHFRVVSSLLFSSHYYIICLILCARGISGSLFWNLYPIPYSMCEWYASAPLSSAYRMQKVNPEHSLLADIVTDLKKKLIGTEGREEFSVSLGKVECRVIITPLFTLIWLPLCGALPLCDCLKRLSVTRHIYTAVRIASFFSCYNTSSTFYYSLFLCLIPLRHFKLYNDVQQRFFMFKNTLLYRTTIPFSLVFCI